MEKLELKDEGGGGGSHGAVEEQSLHIVDAWRELRPRRGNWFSSVTWLVMQKRSEGK